jgi:hypothetical protein
VRTNSVLVGALLLAAGPALGQDLEPRAYSASPVGANFVVAGYGRSTGKIMFDAAAPIANARADLNLATVGYGHVFDLAGHQANISLALPYIWGEASGDVGEDRREVDRSGVGDLRLRASVLLMGGPALSRQTFAARKPKPILGVSLVAVAPTGEYMPDKLVNIGANRWAFKPEIGVSVPMGRWQADAYAAVWLYQDNRDFLGGQKRERDPMSAFQAHVSYTFRPGLWAAVDATYYSGGATTTNGLKDANRQENVRLGLTVSAPVRPGQAVQLMASKGALTRFGGDFTSMAVTWRAVAF